MSMPEIEMNMAPRDADDMPTVSATVPDWSRERPRRFWDPSRKLIRALRRYQAARARSGQPVGILILGAQPSVLDGGGPGGGPPQCRDRRRAADDPSRRGGDPSQGADRANCLIMQQVTIGQNRGKHQNLPVIGGHVDIGPGAKVLGGITIGGSCADRCQRRGAAGRAALGGGRRDPRAGHPRPPPGRTGGAGPQRTAAMTAR
jgi:serine O-acetyltransferase